MSPRSGKRKPRGRDATDATDEYPVLDTDGTTGGPADDDEAHVQTQVLSPSRRDDDADMLASTGRFQRAPQAAHPVPEGHPRPGASAGPEALEGALEQLADLRMLLANRDVQVRDLLARVSAAERRAAELEGELRSERSHREALAAALDAAPATTRSEAADESATDGGSEPQAPGRRRHWWFRLFVGD